MQAIATDIMKSSGGLSVKTMEELILEVIEEGKPLVPEDIKASVIRRIKENISSKNIWFYGYSFLSQKWTGIQE